MIFASGINSCSNSRRFGAVSTLTWAAPVRLPPGRLRLTTRPVRTGSPPIANTIGIVCVAGFAAMAAGVVAARIRLT
jgi:hypothetical protein